MRLQTRKGDCTPKAPNGRIATQQATAMCYVAACRACAGHTDMHAPATLAHMQQTCATSLCRMPRAQVGCTGPKNPRSAHHPHYTHSLHDKKAPAQNRSAYQLSPSTQLCSQQLQQCRSQEQPRYPQRLELVSFHNSMVPTGPNSVAFVTIPCVAAAIAAAACWWCAEGPTSRYPVGAARPAIPTGLTKEVL